MPRAYVLIREQPHYRRESFASGLQALGFTVSCQEIHRAMIAWGSVGPEDVMVTWNRYGTAEQLANRFEACGGKTLVSENGYLGADAQGRQHYALALKGHNGSGAWNHGGPERWEALGLELKPWRAAGEHILVCPNRSFGPKGFAMPQRWAEDVMARLRQRTKREVRVRPHPGNWQVQAPAVPLAQDLKGAWACVIWASSAGLHALLAGIPVYREAPYWIASDASTQGIGAVDSEGPYPERLPAFQRLAFAQWTVDELASGEPFRQLLQ